MRNSSTTLQDTISISIITPKPQKALNSVLSFMIATGLMLLGYGLLLLTEEGSSLFGVIFK